MPRCFLQLTFLCRNSKMQLLLQTPRKITEPGCSIWQLPCPACTGHTLMSPGSQFTAVRDPGSNKRAVRTAGPFARCPSHPSPKCIFSPHSRQQQERPCSRLLQSLPGQMRSPINQSSPPLSSPRAAFRNHWVRVARLKRLPPLVRVHRCDTCREEGLRKWSVSYGPLAGEGEEGTHRVCPRIDVHTCCGTTKRNI